MADDIPRSVEQMVRDLLTQAIAEGLVYPASRRFADPDPQSRPAGGEGYAVFCSQHGSAGDSCQCADHVFRQRPCKHMAAIRKLIEMGRL